MCGRVPPFAPKRKLVYIEEDDGKTAANSLIRCLPGKRRPAVAKVND
jgi:hypothetical protein